MPVIENLKNFIRHGKQARHVNEQQSPAHHSQSHAFSDPAPRHAPGNDFIQQHQKQDFSIAPGTDNRNIAAQAGGAAAHAAGAHQKNPVEGVIHQSGGHGGITSAGMGKKQSSGKAYNDETLAKIVAEEKANRERLPRYPGLERWALQEKMGDGAFSNVYRAKDTAGIYGDVAIKVVRKYELNASQGDKHLHPDFKKAPKTVERANILKEVSIMRRLDHPNIIKLIDFKEEKAYYYLILELCAGGELFHQIVRLTYFSEDLSRHVIVQVADALQYLHEEKGVVHRDIKPENLLFDPIAFVSTKNPKPRQEGDEEKEDEGEFLPGIGAGGIGRIKVADFGLSKVIWEDTTVTPCGTVGYTAPEIVKDERYSKSVDMWALGCVLYTLLCGFPPFYDESITVLTEKVARGQYTFLSPWWDDISKPAQDLVSHLLTVDPGKRYTIEQFMNHPWIKNTKEPTTAALDAPPLATPQPRAETGMSYTPDFIPGIPGTPGANKRMDFRSPGAVSLREVFDVGYAVHRMEEEGKRRKNWKQGYTGVTPQTLNEEDEDYGDSDDENQSARASKDEPADDVAEKMKRANLNAGVPSNTYATNIASARAPVGAQSKKTGAGTKTNTTARKGKVAGTFELSLDNATLLGRRKRGAEDTPVID